MPLQKDEPILELLRNRIIVSHGSIANAKTIETQRLWKHRKKCYLEAVKHIKMAEAYTPDISVMDFSDGDLKWLKD